MRHGHGGQWSLTRPPAHLRTAELLSRLRSVQRTGKPAGSMGRRKPGLVPPGLGRDAQIARMPFHLVDRCRSRMMGRTWGSTRHAARCAVPLRETQRRRSKSPCVHGRHAANPLTQRSVAVCGAPQFASGVHRGRRARDLCASLLRPALSGARQCGGDRNVTLKSRTAYDQPACGACARLRAPEAGSQTVRAW